MPINIEDINILINLFINSELKLNKFSILKKINNKIALNQDDIVVAIGIIMNPISLKRATLISMFSKTDVKEI